MSRRISLLALPVVAVLLIAGCGGGNSGSSGSTTASTSSGSSSGAGQVLKLMADPGGQLRFTTATLTAAKPGKVTLRMTNPSSAGMEHGIAIEGNGVDKDGPIVAPGKTSTITVALKKGTYTYYCPVPGHLQAGMKGTLTVR
jgi:plastocyanin